MHHLVHQKILWSDIIQTILNIDLDFFLSTKPDWPQKYIGYRQIDENFDVLDKNTVKNIFEKHLNIYKQNSIKGSVICDHEYAYFQWKRQIEKKYLHPPFRLIHLDAHSDLGMCGIGGQDGLLSSLRQNNKLPDEYEEQLHCGNYLALAIYNNWISEIVFVYTDNLGRPQDFPKIFFDNGSQIDLNNSLENEYTVNFFDINGFYINIKIQNIKDLFFKDSVDYVSFALSPKYTPPKADKLIPLIIQYIQFD